MTNKNFEKLLDLLYQFSSEWHAYNPPFEITETIKMIEDSLKEQKNTKIVKFD